MGCVTSYLAQAVLLRLCILVSTVCICPWSIYKFALKKYPSTFQEGTTGASTTPFKKIWFVLGKSLFFHRKITFLSRMDTRVGIRVWEPQGFLVRPHTKSKLKKGDQWRNTLCLVPFESPEGRSLLLDCCVGTKRKSLLEPWNPWLN